ncbi:MAG: UDP-glucose 4-epimerase GalE [Acidobacteria bacterium]|nr:UDP-glucose 4-epimerase GalE [Acidobacteriota bacterium]
MKVLVAGGAGYIGAHVARALAERGHFPLIVDDFRRSRPGREGAFPLERIALEDAAALLSVFERHRPEAVIHLGGYISVGESTREPEMYWKNNLGAGINLLFCAARFPISAFLFSSTAAVYGAPDTTPIPESAPLRPINPYGSAKLAFETALFDASRLFGFRAVALRYFNASGAHPEWRTGEEHEPEEHLIPRVLRGLSSGLPAQVFGNDYPTPDGTCVRDYIHVTDLANAHVIAIEAANLPAQSAFNVGTGTGYSVLEVIQVAGKTLGIHPAIEMRPRRPGDPPALVADPAALMQATGWRPSHSSLEEIVESALLWERQRSRG